MSRCPPCDGSGVNGARIPGITHDIDGYPWQDEKPCQRCGGSGIVIDSAPTDRGTETREVECDCVEDEKERP